MKKSLCLIGINLFSSNCGYFRPVPKGKKLKMSLTSVYSVRVFEKKI